PVSCAAPSPARSSASRQPEATGASRRVGNRHRSWGRPVRMHNSGRWDATGEAGEVNAVGVLARSEMRRRARGVVALVLLVGVVGPIVLATAAGARRSESALRRFSAYSRSADLELNVGAPTASQLEAFARSPGVAAIGQLSAYPLIVSGQS